ncbi:hypothetical protein TSUD_47080 [Trifolium subterraneum]|nr:hypothetical protein TSUD_47080 [Trifolium subterraneum]
MHYSLLLPILIITLTLFFNHYYNTTVSANIYYSPLPYHECSTNNNSPNSTYHINLKTLLSWLSSNATPTTHVYNTTITESNTNNTIYGLFTCEIKDNDPNCKNCITNAAKQIAELCPMSKEAIIYAAYCMVRYSNRYFFATVEESPKLHFMNENYAGPQVSRFNKILWDTMNDIRNLTANVPNGSLKYAYKPVNIPDNQMLYAMGNCIPYLSSYDCSRCLGDAIAEIRTSCCKGKTGGRIYFPSCAIRFQLYPFFDPPASTTTQPPQQSTATVPLSTLASSGGKREKSIISVLVVVFPVVVTVVLLCLGCSCFIRRIQRKNQETILKESFGDDVAILESLRFGLGEIESATNKFAKENMIGEGGFGEVYKGVLSNGEEVAVKRLLGSSKQGAREFKNEVLVIARLQHKNLVKLQGFCLDEQEKILIYEYVPNKSLDYFLFDPLKRRQLGWHEKHKIIGGIARGILYLHEDSCLKIMGSFHFLILLPTLFSLFVHCSPSPIIQAAIDPVTHAYYNCTRNSTSATDNAYRSNIKTLLDWLSTNSSNDARYYNTAVASQNTTDTVYGLFLCVRDIDLKICQLCVTEAAQLISSLCTTAKEAIIWYKVCYVHYSDRHFISTVEKSPEISFMNDKDYVGDIGRFNNVLWDMLNDLRRETRNTSAKLANKSANLTGNQTLYGYAWCLPYLSAENCSWCLSDAIAEVPTNCCGRKSGGTILYPSCGVRFELYPFHKAHSNIAWVLLPPTSPGPSAPPVGDDVVILESLRFGLGEIESATNNFAKENMIGEGGFGEVYKGVLSNGEEVAVKRLLGSSKQGAKEFKNEVLVIARLQHKNLVKLQGFYLDEQEKILIYEYVPNKSLDYFLFEPLKRRQLSWHERHKIIGGIARGILYLHEDSRLKIIHRDLKPSNVLLDSNMDPKISDFGMARIVATDNIEENTHRIVGTYGYMSPEYAMHGQFSVKSDVFSFGVMVLEIISGKRKYSSSESDCVDIRKYAWTNWRNQTALELLDPQMEGSLFQNDIISGVAITYRTIIFHEKNNAGQYGQKGIGLYGLFKS